MKSGFTFLFTVLVLLAHSQQEDSTGIGYLEKPKLSRLAITHELSGAVVFPSINVECRIVSVKNWDIDARFGFGGLFQTNSLYSNTIGLSAQYGPGSSKLHISAGTGLYYQYGRQQLDYNLWADEGFYNQHYQYYFSLGYRYEHKHGFIFGIDAYGIGSFTDNWTVLPIGETWPVYPWGGVTFGYRFPSWELHREWRQNRLRKKNKVALLEAELGGDLSIQNLDKDQRKALREIERLEKESMRYLTRSAFYVEGLGAGYLWSFNYEYYVPLLKNELLQLYSRVGIGGYRRREYIDKETIRRYGVVPTPIMVGLRVMKNFRGGGISGGIVPIFSNRGVELGYIIAPEMQVHIGGGVIFGGGFHLLINQFNSIKMVNPWGGFYLGYRIRRIKR